MEMRALVLTTLAASTLTTLLGCDDSKPQARPDAGIEDGGGDGATGDAAVGETWEGCPTADDHVADPTWTEAFTLASDLVTCTSVGENNDATPIGDVFRKKLMLRLPAGSYRLPSDDGTAAYTLPLCLKQAKGAAPTGIDGAGTITKDGDFTTALQPLTAGGARMTASEFWETNTYEVCLTGDDCSLEEGGADMRTMGGACAPDETPWNTPKPGVFRRTDLTVKFEGGELTFDVVTIVGSGDPDLIGLYPAAGPLLSVKGEYEGTPIETSNYWEMAYSAAHHVFGQYFGVVLPEPSGDTCALEVTDVDPFAEDRTYAIYRLDCDFERIGELTYESHTTTDQ